jgi:CubicO group peptidase (beta-lactamase class C family)
MLHGETTAAYAPVGEAFARCFDELGETGAAAAVYVDGVCVADLWGGGIDLAGARPWRADTLVNVYSVGKPFAALPLLRLVDEGRVDLAAPVARYWPEFAQAGKGDIPVRWLLTHQAGLLGLRAPLPAAALFDWQRMCAALAAESPWWEPGTRCGEQALFFGHLVGEVVRRVGGRSIGAAWRDGFATPWALDVHIGLDQPALARCADVYATDAFRGAFAQRGWREALSNPPGVHDPAVVNGRAWRQAEIPAVNAHASARGAARCYGGLAAGGALAGDRRLSAALLEAAIDTQYAGEDVLLGEAVRWGLGFRVDADGFGMGGIGGSLAWGNRAHRFGFAYVTHRLDTHERALRVFAAAARVAGFDPL